MRRNGKWLLGRAMGAKSMGGKALFKIAFFITRLFKTRMLGGRKTLTSGKFSPEKNYAEYE